MLTGSVSRSPEAAVETDAANALQQVGPADCESARLRRTTLQYMDKDHARELETTFAALPEDVQERIDELRRPD